MYEDPNQAESVLPLFLVSLDEKKIDEDIHEESLCLSNSRVAVIVVFLAGNAAC
jgi:hypothetical protein